MWPLLRRHSGIGTDLLFPVIESRAQRFSSTAVYPSCRRPKPLAKSTVVGGGTTDTLLKVKPESLYAREVELVQRAIGLLRAEGDASLIRELEQEQLAAGTSLEWYGITKSAF